MRTVKGGTRIIREGCRLIVSYPGGHLSVITYRSRLAAIIAYWRR